VDEVASRRRLRRVGMATATFRLDFGIALIAVGASARDPFSARLVELLGGIYFLVRGAFRLRWWLRIDPSRPVVGHPYVHPPGGS
jgi:hypothetical protein